MSRRSSHPLSRLGAAAGRLCVMTALLTLAACGGSSGTTYTIGGSISGLTTSSVVLANGNTTLTVQAEAVAWEFPGSFASNSLYSVTVKTQPTGEDCIVTSGASGRLSADVTDVIVACSAGLWTWEGGSSALNTVGVYGTQGTAAASNLPGGRQAASSWVDSSGNVWLFGGYGYDATQLGDLDDLWQYSPSSGQWTWVAGASTADTLGDYAAVDVAEGTNLPGARHGAGSWIDSSGNLWLFGGFGYDSTGYGDLNDLWEYSGGDWIWVGGSDVRNGNGIYGMQGSASTGYMPGARGVPSTWIDSSGDLWLFGGYGRDSNGATANLNDLWEYTPSTGAWTWVSGADTINATGVYGTQNVASTSNVPGARQAATSWIDSSGNLWLFGGYGYDSTGTLGNLNDLWEYTPSTKEWTWVSGSTQVNATGAYGTQSVAAASNVPGARQAADSWIDSSGNLWLFGGYGDDTNGAVGNLADLWEYVPGTGQWTWISGSEVYDATANYGTEGTGAASNLPGSRQGASSWIDSSGTLWLFGGVGYGGTSNGYLNDLWEFVPPQ